MTNAGASPDGIQLTANMDRRVLSALYENLRKHGSRCRLSVGTANAYRLGIAFHQLAQQFRTFHVWEAEPLHFYALRIVWQYCRGVYHQIRAVNVFRGMANVYRNA